MRKGYKKYKGYLIDLGRYDLYGKSSYSRWEDFVHRLQERIVPYLF